MVNVGVEQVFAISLKPFLLALFLTRHDFLIAGVLSTSHVVCGMVYTNAKNHITISITTHSYRAAFYKRIVLKALSKLMDTAAWLCNQCFLQSAVVEFVAAIYNNFGVVSPIWRKWHE